MKESVTTNIFTQIKEFWVEPEIKRRNFTDHIYAVLIVFKPSGPEVIFNSETMLTLEIDTSTGDSLEPNTPITVSQFAKMKIKAVKVPEEIFYNYGFICVVSTNHGSTIYLNFVPNKIDALERIDIAEGFLKAAENVSNEKVKAYNLFQAIEQVVHATLLTHPIHERKIRESKSHGSTKSLVNLESRKGQIPKEVTNLFNKLFENRSKIYSAKKIEESFGQENIEIIRNYIFQIKQRIIQ